MTDLVVIFLGVGIPVFLVFASGLLKTATLRGGTWQCHDYHLGVEFALAHIAVCSAIIVDSYRRLKVAKHAKPNELTAEIIESHPDVVIWLYFFVICGAIICLGLSIGYQRLRVPYVNTWGDLHKTKQGHIVRLGNLKNTYGLTHDFWLGVILFNAIAVTWFCLLLIWMLNHT